MRVAVHNHYEFLTKDGYLFNHENSNIGHNLLKPWNDLYKLCKSTGIEMYTLDQVDPMILDLVIYMDRPMSEPDVAGASKVLIIYEPEMILPGNWDPAYHDQFSRVLTWNDKLVDNKKYYKNNFSVDWIERYPCKCTEGNFFSKKLAVMIQTAKHFPHANSLYTKRLELLVWFRNNAIFDLDLYGPGWEIRSLPFYKGITDNKLQTYQNYKFAITFENCDNAVGYISEKILDAFMAGVVPVYWGAPNVLDHIPAECFVDMRQFESFDDLYKYLNSVDFDRYQQYLEAINEFIISEKADQFDNENCVKRLYKMIEEHR